MAICKASVALHILLKTNALIELERKNLQSEVKRAVQPHQAVNRILEPERGIIEEERGWQSVYLLWYHSSCEVIVINR